MELYADALKVWGLDPLICRTLAPVVREVALNNFDAVHVYVGRERLGKSTLMNRVAIFEAHLMAEYTGGKPRDYFSANSISLTAADYAESVVNAMPKTAKGYDEAVTGMYARRSSQNSNVQLNTMLMTQADKNLGHHICIPNLFALDAEVRYRRVTSVFAVYGKPHLVGGHWVVSRGWADYYAGKDIARIYQDPMTRLVVWPRTQYSNLQFRGFDAKDKAWLAYTEKAGLQKRAIGRDIVESMRKQEKKARGIKDDDN
jgi:hypothetical protein